MPSGVRIEAPSPFRIDFRSLCRSDAACRLRVVSGRIFVSRWSSLDDHQQRCGLTVMASIHRLLRIAGQSNPPSLGSTVDQIFRLPGVAPEVAGAFCGRIQGTTKDPLHSSLSLTLTITASRLWLPHDDCHNSLTTVSASTSWFGPVKSRLNPLRTGVIPSSTKRDRAPTLLDDASAAAAEVNKPEPPLEAEDHDARDRSSPLSQLPLVRFGTVESRLNPRTSVARVSWCPTDKYVSKTAARSLRGTAVNHEL
ncbi:hypothetical protein THAOC_31536 [Thalassiosira oceanica]|uniref:Uncharacterized protein n=1 Tax=Thalassiosira oceanica TaxID=159749 RepID=K0R923_THAOC|nr:hypothetical protein THAOC_31536 [Thalassiosira oceanica]|eukprot:EJK49575.1 hypothetical protein THAOC_31536 [Thalassiosira oceanica]